MRQKENRARAIRQLFLRLEAALGEQHWWPAQSPFEVVVGAYLTQNTAWSNVEKALGNLQKAGALTAEAMERLPLPELEALVRPAGYFRQKAARLHALLGHLRRCHGGSLGAMLRQPAESLRPELLRLPGIGPETADSILLYAAGHEVFVVDAYARRVLERHGLARAGDPYEKIRAAVEQALGEMEADRCAGEILEARAAAARWRGASPEPSYRASAHEPSPASTMPRSERARRYAEFHALLVMAGKRHCRKSEARCEGCPLGELIPKPAKAASDGAPKEIAR